MENKKFLNGLVDRVKLNVNKKQVNNTISKINHESYVYSKEFKEDLRLVNNINAYLNYQSGKTLTESAAKQRNIFLNEAAEKIINEETIAPVSIEKNGIEVLEKEEPDYSKLKDIQARIDEGEIVHDENIDEEIKDILKTNVKEINIDVEQLENTISEFNKPVGEGDTVSVELNVEKLEEIPFEDLGTQNEYVDNLTEAINILKQIKQKRTEAK